MRIVSICPSNTEIVCALGAEDSLVGLDRSSDWPPQICALPRVGPDLSVDIQAIIALKPDLVLSSLSVPGMQQNIDALDAAGLPQLILDAQSLSAVYDSILLTGRLIGRAPQAHQVIAQMQARLKTIQDSAAQLPRKARVFLEWWPKPVIVPGKHCWTTEMIKMAGGESIFADLDLRSTPIQAEAVIERQPDLLLTCWCGVPHHKQRPEKMAERPNWSSIPAVQQGRMYAAEECYFGRPGPRIVEGVAWLHQRILELAL